MQIGFPAEVVQGQQVTLAVQSFAVAMDISYDADVKSFVEAGDGPVKKALGLT